MITLIFMAVAFNTFAAIAAFNSDWNWFWEFVRLAVICLVGSFIIKEIKHANSK